MSDLTSSMLKMLIGFEMENARRMLRGEMDSCMKIVFGEMTRKLMEMVECVRPRDETGNEVTDPTDRGEELNESSNDLISALSNLINSHVDPDSDVATSNQFQDDDAAVTVTNELGIVNTIPNNESIPSSSTQSQPSNDDEQQQQSNDIRIDDDCFDLKDCDCPECVTDLHTKMRDYAQLIENQISDDNGDSNPRPTKRARVMLENDDDGAYEAEAVEVISCRHCPGMFQTKDKLRSHVKEIQSLLLYRSMYDSDQKFHLTRILKPEKSRFQCPYCSAKFNCRKLLMSHVRSHRPPGALFLGSNVKYRILISNGQSITTEMYIINGDL